MMTALIYKNERRFAYNKKVKQSNGFADQSDQRQWKPGR